MRVLHPVSLIAASILVLSLSGCFANPVESIIKGAVKNQTGIDVSTDAGMGSAKLPDDWPGLPIPDGQIVSAISIDGTYVVSMLVKSEQSIESVVTDLEGAGYEASSRSDFGGLKTVQLTSLEWIVSLGWLPGEDAGTFILNYGVSKVEA